MRYDRRLDQKGFFKLVPEIWRRLKGYIQLPVLIRHIISINPIEINIVIAMS